MAFDINSKANIAYKRLLGKIHTSNDREFFNEPESSTFLMSAQDVWADSLHPTDPNDPSNDGVITAQVELDLVPVSGTDNYGPPSAYYVQVPDPVPAPLTGQINKKTGATFVAGDRVGQIVPATFGAVYAPQPKENGTIVPPLDASDWFVDCFSGVLTQETDDPSKMRNYSTNGTILCYIYIGKYVSEKLGSLGGGTTYAFYDHQTIDNGITGLQDGNNYTFTLNNTPVAGSEHVYINGVLQKSGTQTDVVSGLADYYVNGNQIIFRPESTPRGEVIVNDQDGDPTGEKLRADFFEVSYRTET